MVGFLSALLSYPKLTHKTEADGEVALTPAGWTQRFYKLNTGPFRFAKSTLDLSEDLFVETAQILEGTVRIDGHIAPGRLLIGIYESEEPYRLLSREQINRSMAISYDGSQWDATGAAPARGLTLHAAHPVAEQIISASHREKLARRMATPDGRQSLLLSATKEGAMIAEGRRSSVRSCDRTPIEIK